MSESQNTIDEAGARKSKIFVGGLIALIIVGTIVWSTVEYTADIIVDRGESKKFAAVYEKDCQSRYEPEVCKRTAGMHHVSCFKESTSSTAVMDGGVSYGLEGFLDCMRKGEEDIVLQNM